MAKTNHNHKITDLRVWNQPVYQTEKWRKKGRGKYQVKRKKSFRKPFRKPFLAKSQNFVKYGEKLKNRKYRGRYFVIAQAIGYKWAEKKGEFNKNECRAIGYAFALMPNILKNSGKWGMRWDKYGHPMGRPKIEETNEERLIDKIDKIQQVSIGRFDLFLYDEKVCSPKMHALNWWTADNYDRYLSRLTDSQIQTLYSAIDEEWKRLKLDCEKFNYKYCQNYFTFFQPMMEILGDKIYS